MLINSRRAELLRSTCEDFVETYRRAVCFSVAELGNTADASEQMVQTGLSNYSSTNVLNIVTGGGVPAPFNAGTTVTGSGPNRVLPGSIFLALMTAVDQDSGTGGLEVGTAGNSGYLRVQVAGTLTTSAVSGTSSTGTLTFTSVPAWIQNGMFVQNILPVGTASTGTASIALGTSVTGTTATQVTLSTPGITGSVGSGDIIQFTAFQLATQSGTTGANNASEPPAQVSNNSIITFPAATGGTAPGFGTVMAFELRDGSTGGNLLLWDFLGNFQWQPTTIGNGSGAILTAHAHGYTAGQAIIYSTEYGGTAPTGTGVSNFSTSGSGVLVVTGSGLATDTFGVTNGGTNVVTSTTGNGMTRAVTQQSIPAGVTASFAVGALVATAA